MTDHRNDEGRRERFVPFVQSASPRNREAASLAFTSTDLPPVLVTSRDHRRLRSLVSDMRDEIDGSILECLAYELDRAAVYRPNAIPPDVVTMNSRILFRRDLGQPPESRTLVYNDAHSVLGGTISILTPLGVALLGLREGSTMPYVSRDGTRWVIAVEKVAYQPEGEGRLMRAPHRYWPGGQRVRPDTDRASPAPDQGDSGRTAVPLPPRPTPRPVVPDNDDDGGPDRAS